MIAINDLKLIGALSAPPTLQHRSGYDVLEGTVTMETAVNGRMRTTYVPFVVIGKAARPLFERVGAGSIVSLAGVARQERWGEHQEFERVRFVSLRSEIVGAAGSVRAGKNGPHLTGGKNAVTIGGNLTAAPVMQTVKVGDEQVLKAEFSVALNERYTKDGKRVTRVSYLNVTAWREQAELAQGLGKGQAVTIDGAVFGDSYTTKDNQKRNTLKFEAIGIYPVETPAALPTASD